MCHIVLFLPAFALPVFWFLPLSSALPLYLFILTISFILYFKVMQAMHQRVRTGQEGMLTQKAIVIQDIDPEGKIQYAGEIWNAKGGGKRFFRGEQVVIREFIGLTLIVDEMPLEENALCTWAGTPQKC